MTKPPLEPDAKGAASAEPLTRHWRKAFLGALADTSNVSAAARSAGVTAGHAYKVRRTDAAFAREWQSALCEGYDNLEMELLYRLRSGGGDEDAGRKFDNSIAFRLLTVHRDSAARERAIRDNRDAGQILESINAKLDRMRERALTAAATAAAAAVSETALADDE